MMSNKTKEKKLNAVFVTGDVTIDNYIYEGERDSSYKRNARGVKYVTEPGGAGYINKILNALLLKAAEDEERNSKKETPEKRFNINENWMIATGFPTQNSDWQVSYSLWKLCQYKDDKFVIRMHKELGYGDQTTITNSEVAITKIDSSKQNKFSPKILIVDDGGSQFRLKSEKVNWNLDKNLDWIILKMSRPIATGDLWEELIKNYADKLIVIVSADELRAEDIKIAKGSSWEQTIEDTRNALFTIQPISNLTKCRNLIISYNNDGALLLDNSDRKNPAAKLLCDSARAENEWSEKIQGRSFGYMSCLTSAIAYKLIDNSVKTEHPNLVTGIECGLSAMRNLLEFGHYCFEKNKIDYKELSGFPANRIADEIRNPKHKLSNIDIPWLPPAKINNTGKWMIAEMLQRSPSQVKEISLNGLATQVVYYGTKILSDVPHAVFTKLTTTDRGEIETLRQLKRFMIDFRNNPSANKPISFGVFGPPGAGKSFGVKQIVSEIFKKESWLEFNLSQFSVGSLSELYGAFHQIRDKALSGIIPVAFMDEFDSKKYEWLQYLLSPLQDGEFQEGQLKHSIGKCIFIFAGATSYTYDSFGVFKNDVNGKEAYADFVLKKGPDFKSRLDGYINVLGPNQRMLNHEKNEVDPCDISFPLRRAIFITTKVKYHSYLPAQIDSGLVNALLRVPKYVHGARSLDKLLSLLQSSDGTTLSRSKIPADIQLAMYADPVEFNKLLLEPQQTLQYLPIDELAPAIHESFRKLCNKKGWAINTRFNRTFNDLDNEAKEDNKAAAFRIQQILATVNLKIEKAQSSEIKLDKSIKNHLEYHIELLSTLEHNGWWMQKLKFDWKYDKERNDDKKFHNLLKPYSDLPNDEKEKDRNSIRDYPERLRLVGYRITWLI